MKYIMMAAFIFATFSALNGEEGKAEVPQAVEEKKTVETPQVKEIPAPAVGTAPAQTAPIPETVPVVETVPAVEAVSEEPVGCVSPLKQMVSFHQAEIINFKKIIQRWNDKVSAILKRREDMEKDILDRGNQIDELSKSEDKKNAKEIARLHKQSKRVKKDIVAIGKELKAQSKGLAAEIKTVSKESQAALKEQFKSVIQDIRVTEN